MLVRGVGDVHGSTIRMGNWQSQAARWGLTCRDVPRRAADLLLPHPPSHKAKGRMATILLDDRVCYIPVFEEDFVVVIAMIIRVLAVSDDVVDHRIARQHAAFVPA